MISTDIYKLAADGKISREELAEIEALDEVLSRAGETPAAVLGTGKEARVFGAADPGADWRPGASRKKGRKKWRQYLESKSQEEATPYGRAAGTGAAAGSLAGLGVGALTGGMRGALIGGGVGALGGGLVGGAASASDRAEIDSAKKILRSGDKGVRKAYKKKLRRAYASHESAQRSREYAQEARIARLERERRQDSQKKVAAMPAPTALRTAGETALGGILAGLGLYGAQAAGAGIHHGIRALADKVTYRKDLGRVLAVHPDIAEEFSPKDIDLVYRSIRTFSPEAAKDPLVGGRVLDSVLRNRDRMNPGSAPRFELGTAQELQRLRAGTDRGGEMASTAFLTGARAAIDARADARQMGQRQSQAQDLAKYKAELDLRKAMAIEDYKEQFK